MLCPKHTFLSRPRSQTVSVPGSRRNFTYARRESKGHTYGGGLFETCEFGGELAISGVTVQRLEEDVIQ